MNIPPTDHKNPVSNCDSRQTVMLQAHWSTSNPFICPDSKIGHHSTQPHITISSSEHRDPVSNCGSSQTAMLQAHPTVAQKNCDAEGSLEHNQLVLFVQIPRLGIIALDLRNANMTIALSENKDPVSN